MDKKEAVDDKAIIGSIHTASHYHATKVNYTKFLPEYQV